MNSGNMCGRMSAKARVWATAAALAMSIAEPAAAQAVRDVAPATAPQEAPETAHSDDVDIDTLLAEAIPEMFGPAQSSEPVEPVEPNAWLKDKLPPEVLESWARIREQAPAMAARGFSAAREQVPPSLARRLHRLAELTQRPEAPGWGLQAAGGLLVLLLLARLARGRGDVAVSIGYPAELRGTYSLRLTTRKPKNRLSGRILTPAAAQAARRRSRTEQHMVCRETQFSGIPSGALLPRRRWFPAAAG